MKINIHRVIGFSAFILLVFAAVSSAQVTSSRSNNETQTSEVERAQLAANDVLRKAETAFKDGLIAYENRRLNDPKEKFDKSLEAFLTSAQSQPKVQACFDQVIKTIYLIEFPSVTELPQVRNLALTCNWKTVDNDLADRIIGLARSSATKTITPASSETAGPVATTANVIPAGFESQEFVPAIGDELARVQLTQEEQQVDANPVAQQQYQYIQYAVANKSLGFSFQVHPMIQQYINYYRGRGRTTMEVGLYRSGMFMLMARRIFREEGIPENVAWLGQVESAWKPAALSWASASGLWQFIPGTGARYGLQRNAYVDERNSFEEATRASARYLKFLYNRYNNWELGIAAYNCGEGNVDRAIRRAGVANFWLAYPYLPQETRNYVPNILATILIANNPGQYGFGHIRPAAPLKYDRVRIPASTNLSLIAQASDTTVQYLRYLNPHLRGNVTPPQPYIINVPPEKANDVVAIFKRIPATKIPNTGIANSSSGDSWQNISNRTGVSIADLMAANPGMSQPHGKVFVPLKGNGVQATNYSRPTSQPVTAATNLRIIKAKTGETITKIAEREGLSATEVAKFNGLLPNSVLTSGREIKIPAGGNK